MATSQYFRTDYPFIQGYAVMVCDSCRFGITRIDKNAMNVIQVVGSSSLIVQLAILYRNGISITHIDIIPALLSGYVAYFLFVIGEIYYFTQQDGDENEESRIIHRGSLMIAGCLVGWIAALWMTENVALEKEFFDTVQSLSQVPRYLSLLLV